VNIWLEKYDATRLEPAMDDVGHPHDHTDAASSHDHGAEHAHPDPLRHHLLRDDPLTTLAAQRLTVGGRTLLALSDGFFSIESFPTFLGSPDRPRAFYEDMATQGVRPPRMPIGAFVWPGERNVLIDAGFGPRVGGSGAMVGGQLPRQLRRFGFGFDDIHVIAISHLHPDHTGWLADSEGNPLFTNAHLHLGARDWNHFVASGRPGLGLDPNVRQALITMADAGRVTLQDTDATIAPGIRLLRGPGHTPGHSLYVVEDGGDRAIMFGDAIYCPQQLTETDWAATSDVDPVAARATRERYVRELEQGGGLAVGCHFPGLRAGRILSGAWRPA
jgi:glyoxylase-like metal-dependent hydrolase (beta-lactamase superfamily II)